MRRNGSLIEGDYDPSFHYDHEGGGFVIGPNGALEKPADFRGDWRICARKDLFDLKSESSSGEETEEEV